MNQKRANSFNERPRLRPEPGFIDRFLEISGWLLLALMWGFILYVYPELPDRIPTHYNAQGVPDAYGSASSIWLLPVLGTVLFGGLTFLNRYPHLFKYNVNITMDNAFRQYSNATRTVRYLKTVIVFIFALILIFTYRTATGLSEGLWKGFLPLVLTLTIVPMIYFAIRAYRIK